MGCGNPGMSAGAALSGLLRHNPQGAQAPTALLDEALPTGGEGKWEIDEPGSSGRQSGGNGFAAAIRMCG